MALNAQQQQQLNSYGRKDFEALGRELLQNGGGQDALQKALKDAIAKNKALDADVTRERKAADAAERDLEKTKKEALGLDYRRADMKRAIEDLLASNAKIEEVLAATASEKENKDEVPPHEAQWIAHRTKFMAEVAAVREKNEKQRADSNELAEKNEKLRADFNARKSEFDERIQEKISKMKQGSDDSVAKITLVQQQLTEFELLERKVERDQKELEVLRTEAEQLQERVELYEAKIDEFRRLADTTAETVALYEGQRADRAKQIATLETAKREAVEAERESHAASHKLRTVTLKELKKRIANLDKEKTVLANKSRELAAKAAKK